MNRFAVTFALLCVLSSSFAFNFQDCGSELGKFGDITISSCTPSDEKCILNRGIETQVTVKFTPTKDISQMETRAFAVLLDVPMPFPMKKPDVCKDSSSGVKCPLKKDQEVEYKTIFVVDKDVLPINLDIIWELANENNQKVVCVKFPAIIK